MTSQPKVDLIARKPLKDPSQVKSTGLKDIAIGLSTMEINYLFDIVIGVVSPFFPKYIQGCMHYH